jgi:hypothetical protein
VPFDKRNAAMLKAVGFCITDQPGDTPGDHGETASDYQGAMMARPSTRNVCDRCRQSFDQRLRSHVRRGPMVHDHIWQQLANCGEQVLCDGCMYARAHERLGRVLTLADLQPRCLWNLVDSPNSWLEFFGRATDERARGSFAPRWRR